MLNFTSEKSRIGLEHCFWILPSHFPLDSSNLGLKGIRTGDYEIKKLRFLSPLQKGEKTDTEKIHFGMGTFRDPFRIILEIRRGNRIVPC